MLVVALALLGSTFTVDAKVKKRRSTTKKERTIKNKKTSKKVKAKVEKSDLDMVEYYFQGMMMTPWARINVEHKDGKAVMGIQSTTGDEKEYVLDDGEQLLNEALKIIEEEKMLDYAASYSLDPSMQVLDGYYWSFSARLADGRSVNSHGRNVQPGGRGLSRISNLLLERAQKLLGID